VNSPAIRVAIINNGTLHLSASNFSDFPGIAAEIDSPGSFSRAASRTDRFAQGDVVIDPARNLMWSRKPISTERKTFSEAEAACKACMLEGHTDWRLPTREELQSLVDYNRYNPAIDPELFPETPANYFWSSSPDASDPGYAWVVYFYHGYVHLYYRYSSAFVRAVRSVPASQ
jgi:hypothetical protein